MKTMDHTEATRLQAAEKYILGELPQALREEYEEHFFDCAACALDIKAAAALADTTREVLREQPQRDRFRLKDAAPVSGGWFGWLRPAFAMPAFAALALLVVVGYQNTVTIPQLKNAPSTSVAQISYGHDFLLPPSAVRRGSELRADQASASEPRIEIRSGDAFLLSFDFTPTAATAGAPAAYLYELQDASGHVLLQSAIPPEGVNQRLHLPVAAGLVTRPGAYNLVFFRSISDSGSPVKGPEAQRIAFTVAFHQ
jgi:hypothetical protein